MSCHNSKISSSKMLISSNDLFHFELREGYTICISPTLDNVVDIWTKLAPTDNLFLQVDYLKALETYPPLNMTFSYILILHPSGIGKDGQLSLLPSFCP